MRTAQDIIRAGATGLLAASLTLSLVACGGTTTASTTTETSAQESATDAGGDTNDTSAADNQTSTDSQASTSATDAQISQAAVTSGGVIDTTDLFTERDLTQVADTSDATSIELTSGQDVTISKEGVYVITGEATETTIRIDVEDNEKVQLVLNGVSISNTDAPAIYVLSADKVFVTTVEGTTNSLEVTGSFQADGDTNTDAVIFSKDDLTLNGLGTLVVSSTDNGISCKDDLKVTGGTYQISCTSDALEANDSISISDGSFQISAQKDGLHAEDGDDDTTGSVYICGGSFQIDAGSDGIQATTYLQLDGGTFTIDAREGLEATYVQVNGGVVGIEASDDGINGSTKSASLGTPVIEVTGGELSISMAQGDTDAIDVNGNLVISGGTIDITGQFAFDFDGTVDFTGGEVTVNGEKVTTIESSMMMGGGMGGGMGAPQGDMGGEMPSGGPGDGMGHGPRGDWSGESGTGMGGETQQS